MPTRALGAAVFVFSDAFIAAPGRSGTFGPDFRLYDEFGGKFGTLGADFLLLKLFVPSVVGWVSSALSTLFPALERGKGGIFGPDFRLMPGF